LIGNSRVLLQFDLNAVSQSVSAGDISGSVKYYLNLEVTQEDEIETDYRLYVYPVKESWVEGLGKESDTPHNVTDVSWVYRASGSTWDVANENVNDPFDPQTIAGLIDANLFTTGIGNFRLDLSQSIKGIDGTAPTASIVGERLELSASNYGGGTVVTTASLEAGSTYYVNFEIDPYTLTGIDFRVAYNGTYLTSLSNYTQSITAPATQSVYFTAPNTGDYEMSFTFYDRDGVVGSA